MDGEFGWDTNVRKYKQGDGVSTWANLAWWKPVTEDSIASFLPTPPTVSLTGYPRTIVQTMAAAFTGGDVTTVQPFFSAASQAVTLEAGKTYLLEGMILMSRAAGITSHTIATMFAGTATFAAFGYVCDCRDGAYLAATPIRPYINHYNGTVPATAITVNVAQTTVNSTAFYFKGKFTVTAAGTLIPQFQYSAAPGGTPVIDASSWFAYTKLN